MTVSGRKKINLIGTRLYLINAIITLYHPLFLKLPCSRCTSMESGWELFSLVQTKAQWHTQTAENVELLLHFHLRLLVSTH